jgi:hypothetical protein
MTQTFVRNVTGVNRDPLPRSRIDCARYQRQPLARATIQALNSSWRAAASGLTLIFLYESRLADCRWSGRFILDSADDGGEYRTRNAATGYLADDAADIWRRSRVGEQRNQHAEDLPPGAAADRTCDGVSNRPKIDVLGGARGDIPADGAADDLYDQVDE